MAKYQGKGKASKPAHRGRRGLTLGMSTAGVIIVAVAIGWFAYRASADLPGEKFADLGNEHIQTSSDPHTPYNSEPPTSGPHLPYIAPWGVHTRPLPKELQVHNLEDGGVMVQYNCECPELVEKLRNIVRKYDKQVILAPYPTMKSRIALTAWTRLEKFDEFDEKRIVRFIDAYRGIDHHKR
jgi:acylphosphatase